MRVLVKPSARHLTSHMVIVAQDQRELVCGSRTNVRTSLSTYVRVKMPYSTLEILDKLVTTETLGLKRLRGICCSSLRKFQRYTVGTTCVFMSALFSK